MLEKIVVMDQMLALATMYSKRDYTSFKFFGDVQLPFIEIGEEYAYNRLTRTDRNENTCNETCIVEENTSGYQETDHSGRLLLG